NLVPVVHILHLLKYPISSQHASRIFVQFLPRGDGNDQRESLRDEVLSAAPRRPPNRGDTQAVTQSFAVDNSSQTTHEDGPVTGASSGATQFEKFAKNFHQRSAVTRRQDKVSGGRELQGSLEVVTASEFAHNDHFRRFSKRIVKALRY